MEQKQLDEIDESYFGEEFIEEETPEEQMVLKAKHERKALAAKRIAEKAAKEVKEVSKKVTKETTKEFKVSMTKPEPVKVETYHDEAVTIKPAKEEFKPAVKPVVTVKEPVETAKPVNPWAEESKQGTGMFKETSTWQALTAIVVILLLLSILTQGFRFSEKEGVGSAITLTEAQTKAVSYVNTKLLQPPFTAEVKSAEETATLYKFKLSVAGQEVDSYMTKDGALFFPQGLDLTNEKTVEVSAETTNETTKETETTNKTASPIVSETNKADSTKQVSQTTEPKSTTETKPAATIEPKKANTPQVTLVAKRWLFTPDRLVVKQGQPVILTVKPEDLNFEFSITGLGITKKIPGLTTNIEFTPQKAGTYTFSCSNCEDWRGMKGTLVVE